MTNGESWVNPLPDGTSLTMREPEKKDLLRGSFFSYRPSAGAAPLSVPTQQTVYVVAPKLAEQFYLFIQTPLDRRCMVSLAFHASLGSLHIDKFGGIA